MIRKKPSYIFIFILSILITTSISSISQATSLKQIKYKTSDGTLITAYMMRPKRKGRFPAIVALHGCSGLKKNKFELLSRHQDWGERLVQWGYVVLFPDSYGSRNVRSLCKTKRRLVTYEDRILDARSAKNWLDRQRYVNSKNINLLGWSEGAGTILRMAYSKHGKGFRKSIAFYPECRSLLTRKKLKLHQPLSILVGARDDWTPPEPCQKLIWNAGGNIILYKKAHHGFDIPNARLSTVLWVAYSKRGDGIVMVGTNKKARAQAIKDVRKILR